MPSYTLSLAEHPGGDYGDGGKGAVMCGRINGIGDINVYNVPIFRALVGAIILVAIWQLLTVGLRRGCSRSA